MKLTYTKEMEQQDNLWKTEEEDLVLMEKLQNDIKNEAIEKGFKGVIDIYEASGEIVAEIYSSEEEFEQASNGEIDFGGDNMTGNCQYLIKKINLYHEIK